MCRHLLCRRLLCRRLGASMVYSEFVAADALVRMVSRSLDKLTVCPEERPVAIQIYGRDPIAVRDAAQIVVERARPDVLDHYQMCKNTARLSAAGGVKITAMDLAKYMLMHMNYGKSPLAKARVISEASARRMQTVITDDANANTEKERAGLGLMRADEFTPGTELVGHTGGAYGLRSAMFFDPVKKYGFVVITNGSGSRKVLQRSLTLMRDHFIK